MKLILLRLTVACLILISSKASAGETPALETIKNEAKNPAEFVCLDDREVKEIANFKKKCDLSEMNMNTYKVQFESCLDKTICDQTITSSKTIFWSSVVSALVIGFMAGQR